MLVMHLLHLFIFNIINNTLGMHKQEKLSVEENKLLAKLDNMYTSIPLLTESFLCIIWKFIQYQNIVDLRTEWFKNLFDKKYCYITIPYYFVCYFSWVFDVFKIYWFTFYGWCYIIVKEVTNKTNESVFGSESNVSLES